MNKLINKMRNACSLRALLRFLRLVQVPQDKTGHLSIVPSSPCPKWPGIQLPGGCLHSF